MKYIILLCSLLLIVSCSGRETRTPYLSEKDAAAVAEGLLRHGLTKTQVSQRLGVPEKTYGYQKNMKDMEVWVYSELEWHEYENVLFEDGAVAAWNVPDSVKDRLDEVAVTELLEKGEVVDA